eukprot:Em0003g1408a
MMGCSYLFAFASLYHQIPGLYGPKGLTPVQNVLPQQSNATYWEKFKSLPSLLIFSLEIGISPHLGMELCCLLGIVLSLGVMSFRAMRSSVVFFLLWLFYLSVYKVGQIFLWFQWDSLILEAGFLCVLVAPLNLLFWKRPEPRSHDGMTLWLVKWLLFRLMFASGVVKLTSLCPTWWALTALNYHYESQCIPTPLSWYFHQLPEWVQKLSVVGTYFIEICVPLLFFVPVRSLRVFSAWSQVFLQVLIILTGNYNFFNFVTISLCISLLDDDFWSASQQDSSRNSLSKSVCNAISGLDRRITQCGCFVIFTTLLGALLALTVYYFGIRYEDQKILSDIRFTETSFKATLSTFVPLLVVCGAISLFVEILSAVLCSLSQPCIFNKLWHLLQTVVMASLVIVIFSISLVPFGTLDSTFYKSIPSDIHRVHGWMDNFAVTHSYGLFRRMTGVGGRPELIIEGTNNVDTEQWMEYEFLYKPGDTYKPPTYVAPHQPRLDWQMWFAALGSYEHNPWLVHLVYKLLIGQKEVLQLMRPAPFASPPRFIRVQRYLYHYTPINASAGLWDQSQKWWYREYQGEYIFPLTQDNHDLIEYLKKQKFLPEPHEVCTHPTLCDLLNIVREHSSNFSAVLILWSLAVVGVLTTATLKLTFS